MLLFHIVHLPRAPELYVVILIRMETARRDTSMVAVAEHGDGDSAREKRSKNRECCLELLLFSCTAGSFLMVSFGVLLWNHF